MSLWKSKVFVEWQRVERLSGEQLRKFVLASVRHAFTKNEHEYREEVGEDKTHLVAQAIAVAWEALAPDSSEKTTKELAKEISSIRPGEDSPDYFVFGWDYLLFALASALNCIAGVDIPRNAIYAVLGSFQSVADSEVNEALSEQGGLDANQVAEVEELSHDCQEEVKFQLRCLQRIEAGEEIAGDSAVS